MIFSLKVVPKIFLISFASFIAVMLLFYFIYKTEKNEACNSLEKLALDTNFIQKMRDGVESNSKNRELKFNQFMTAQIDPDEFNLLNIKEDLVGLNISSDVGVRLDAPRGKYEKTIDKIKSISVLIDRCCILKIPMSRDLESAIEITDIERKFQKKIDNPQVYLSCQFELINQ